jgi:hypothetical protein
MAEDPYQEVSDYQISTSNSFAVAVAFVKS